MLKDPWDYALSLYREDWSPLAEVRIEPDWEPALEWVRLSVLNAGRTGASGNHAEVHPLWHGASGTW